MPVFPHLPADTRRRTGTRTARATTALGAMLLTFSMVATPALAQVRPVDPDAAIDGDLGSSGRTSTPPVDPGNGTPVDSRAYDPQPVDAGPQSAYDGQPVDGRPADQRPVAPQAGDGPPPPQAADASNTYRDDDLIGAAEGVFGKGAKGLADVIRGLLKKQGRPNAYIVGREAGGAFAVGLRYGSGTLHHKIEGERPVYWTGPSIGFDAGGNAASAFVLVYNLYDTEDLFKRFGAGEGQAYVVGGFNVSYLRRGNIVLIPVRAGAGLRLGANIGYMKFSHKQNWMPF